MFSLRLRQMMERCAAVPTTAASLRIFFMRASGLNFFAFFNADGGQHAENFRAECGIVLLLYHFVDFMEEGDVLCMQGVEVFVGYIVIFDRLGIVLFGQRVEFSDDP
jgi:hypothetical protein